MLRFRTPENRWFATVEGGMTEKSFLRIFEDGLKDGTFIKKNGKEPGSIAYIANDDVKITGNITIMMMKGTYVVHIPNKNKFWFW